MPLEEWKQGEPIAAAKLNQPVRAINDMQLAGATPVAGPVGRVFRFGRVITATPTGVQDTNGEDAQDVYVIHEVQKVRTGYTTSTNAAWVVLPEGVGFRGNGYNLAEDNFETADLPAELVSEPLKLNSIVIFTEVWIPNTDGTYTREAIIWPIPRNAECA